MMETLLVSSYPASLALLAVLWGIAGLLSWRARRVMARTSRRVKSVEQRQHAVQIPDPRIRARLKSIAWVTLGLAALYFLHWAAAGAPDYEALYLAALGALAASPIRGSLQIARLLSELGHARFTGYSPGEAVSTSDRLRVIRDDDLASAALFLIAAAYSRTRFFAGAAVQAAFMAARMQLPLIQSLRQELDR